MTVLSLWAIVRTVQSANSDLMVCCMRSSVSRSTAAVASSSTRIFVLRSKLLAKHSSCLCPTLTNENRKLWWQHKQTPGQAQQLPLSYTDKQKRKVMVTTQTNDNTNTELPGKYNGLHHNTDKQTDYENIIMVTVLQTHWANLTGLNLPHICLWCAYKHNLKMKSL